MPEQELLFADAHRLSDYFGSDTQFDLVLSGEVIEHLPNPGMFLESVRSVLAPGGCLLITTVNAFSVTRFAKALLNHEVVHPEHTVYFSPATLRRLTQMSGLRVTKLGYYHCEPITRFSLNLLVSNSLEHALASLWPQFSEGLVAEVITDD